MTKERRSEFFKMLKKHRMFYLFLLPAVVMVFLFSYMPFWGILIAFKDFKMARGIMGSEWVGLAHFRKLFSDPHFLSWVVVGTFAYQILSPSSGIVNTILVNLGILDKSVYFMAQPNMFVPIYLIVNLWKGTGYSIVVYLAVISGIDTEQYEAVFIDGANRFQKILYVTLPAMLPTICVMLILNIGTIITVGFDPIFNLYNDATYQTADVISTFVYRKGMVDAQFDYSTAVGLFQNVVSLTLVLLSNWFDRKANPEYRVI